MTTPSRRALSARLVARQSSELMLARWLRWTAFAPHERLSSVVFDVVLSASTAHRPFRDPASEQWIGIDDAHGLRRPVTGMAIAHSMGIPHTSVRRRAAELVDAGMLVRGTGGFRIAERLFIDGSIGHLAAGDAADLTRSLQALAMAAYAPAVAAIDAGVAALPAGVVSRLILAFALRGMETLNELYGDAVNGIIMAAIIAINVRHITADPQLAQLYAGEATPPPDPMRRPTAIRALARELGVPFETVRRRVGGLIAEGRVQWLDDGVIVPSRVLLSDRHLAYNIRIVRHFDQMLKTLVTLAAETRR